MTHQSKTRGVTLVEIAIVLVIIGLLLGGVLKGQELINNAKVRAMADRQSSLKVAWFSFIDRFGSIPGDYVYAKANIPGALANGTGDGQVNVLGEAVNAMQNLTGAGYLRCSQCTGADNNNTTELSAKNTLVNQYGGAMGIFHGQKDYAALGANNLMRLMVRTGTGIPSNIIAEVDRKIDDGIANTGELVFSAWQGPGAAAPAPDQCMARQANPDTAANAAGGTFNAAVVQGWRGALAVPAIDPNCGAAVAI